MAAETSIEKREAQTIQPERIESGRTYVPRVDIIEQDDELLLLADMPGVRPDDVDIRYERGELTIHGRVQPRQGPAQVNYLICEYGVGDFWRVFGVGEGLDSNRIEAELKDGVLTVHLPKTQAMRPRKIAVKAR